MHSPEMLKRLNRPAVVKKSRRLAKLTNGIVRGHPKDVEKGRAVAAEMAAGCYMGVCLFV